MPDYAPAANLLIRMAIRQVFIEEQSRKAEKRMRAAAGMIPYAHVDFEDDEEKDDAGTEKLPNV